MKDYNLQRLRWRRQAQKRASDRRAASHPCAAPVHGRACKKWGKVLIAGKWFCADHAPSWSVHYAIVDRIRAL